ncbi:hypothetical protein GBAR_LOCUS15620 [Geodia barretti]|uniref:Uncharacterized protein n=1 Tax=Geodia barretti TaxID=519541 RepID=A0AA35SBZ0_GEOBA|nr:hypothetical protein GBAR_LOCUS15620 [Geodia barretti]
MAGYIIIVGHFYSTENAHAHCTCDHVVESGHFASRSVRKGVQFRELRIYLSCLRVRQPD